MTYDQQQRCTDCGEHFSDLHAPDRPATLLEAGDDQLIPAITSLPQMIREAIAIHPTSWARDFPRDASEEELRRVKALCDVYARCIAFALGAIYPGATIGRHATMDAWRADFTAVQTIIADAARDLDPDPPHTALMRLHDLAQGRVVA